jgi:hypothetical protein
VVPVSFAVAVPVFVFDAESVPVVAVPVFEAVLAAEVVEATLLVASTDIKIYFIILPCQLTSFENIVDEIRPRPCCLSEHEHAAEQVE